MTLAEIEVVCMSDKPEVWNDFDLHAYAQWWRSMTPEQQLWAAEPKY